MLKKDYILTNVNGLTSRISSNIVSFANRFSSFITLTHKDEVANLKSIMNVMALIIKNNESFTITCTGEDEKIAMESINNYLKNLDIVK